MKIATFNINSIRMRLPVILRWVEEHRPDALCLQETKVQDSEFPALGLASTGYHVVYRGMKAYNGVAVMTRAEPDAVFHGFDDGGEPDEARIMRVVLRGIPILNTYVPNGFKIVSPKYAYKLEWFKRLRGYFERHLSADKPAVWCGDMNVAPEAIDVHNPDKHTRHVCFHEDVRRAYKEAAAWGFVDVFRQLYPDRQQFTFWDYLRPNSLDSNKGWRIDHILATPPMADKCKKVEVDIEPRRAPQSSDHTFLWAEFEL